MPTAAKLVGGLCLAILGYIASELIKPLMPAGTAFGIFNYVNMTLGFVCGWVVVGPRAGRGWASGISNGFTGTVALVAWGLFVQGANEMVARAMKHRYDGPVEAFAATFEIIIEYAGIMADASVLIPLAIGAVITGLCAEYAGKHWK